MTAAGNLTSAASASNNVLRLDHRQLERSIRAGTLRNGAAILTGFRLLPTQSKRPFLDGAFRTSSADPDERQRLARSRHDGWGVWHGASRLLVVDIDVHGANGYDSIDGLIQPHEAAHMWLTSPSGGLHLFYRAPSWAKRRIKVLPGVDVLADDGQSVVSGPGRELLWDQTPLSAPPGAILELIRPKERVEVPRKRRGDVSRRLAGAARFVANATEGSRNATLNGLAFEAGRAAIGEGVAREVVEDVFTAAALSAGLTPRETARTLRSALDA